MSSLRLAVAHSAGQLAGHMSRLAGRGRGETLQGRVVLALDNKALIKLSARRDIVLVTGTNGKTTTTANLAHILADGTGEKVSTSKFGANMRAGIASVLSSKPRHRLVVLECDELYVPEVYKAIKPKVIVLLNLSRDQLHRTGEVRKVAQLWKDTFIHGDVTLVIDRDDPFLEYAASSAGHVLRVTFGGRRHPDAATCPSCARIIDWSTGDYRCDCGLGSELAQVRGDQRLSGPGRNAVLAIEAARLMGGTVDIEMQNELTANAPDRTAQYEMAGHSVLVRLAKNPESWRGALASVASEEVVLSVNARGIDGRDTSWLWDIDYSQLVGRRIVCTGERRLDVAYRLHVQGADVKLANTFDEAIAMCSGKHIEAIASYTAFQDLASRDMGITRTIGRD